MKEEEKSQTSNIQTLIDNDVNIVLIGFQNLLSSIEKLDVKLEDM